MPLHSPLAFAFSTATFLLAATPSCRETPGAPRSPPFSLLPHRAAITAPRIAPSPDRRVPSLSGLVEPFTLFLDPHSSYRRPLPLLPALFAVYWRAAAVDRPESTDPVHANMARPSVSPSPPSCARFMGRRRSVAVASDPPAHSAHASTQNPHATLACTIA